MKEIYIVLDDEWEIMMATTDRKQFHEAVKSTINEEWEIWENGKKKIDSYDTDIKSLFNQEMLL